LPEEVGFTEALTLAGINGKMEVLDFSFDFSNRYTFWSGITGGLFLALSYFGTDQSQVQRYLSGRSIKASRMGLVFNGLIKVPMQFFILLVGVMVFVFFQFNQSPVFFNTSVNESVLSSEVRSDFEDVDQRHKELFKEKRAVQLDYVSGLQQSDESTQQNQIDQIISFNTEEKQLREEAKAIIKKSNSNIETNDKDYVFIHFILNYLPRGLIGLLLAVILSAAMSSTASELNALASTTTVDIYKRNIKSSKDDRHFLLASKGFTILWGIIAISFACFGTLFENLIQFVNIIGSVFYGTILGIFLTAFYVKRIKGDAIFYAAIISECLVILVWYLDLTSFLWLNVIGCVVTMVLAFLFQEFKSHKMKQLQ